jgi:DNA uptake protein ComE-like DNA-binding protein
MFRPTAILLSLVLSGCLNPSDEPSSDARGAQFARDLSAAEEFAVLSLANTASAETLDEDVALDVRAARGIVAQRPFDTTDQLDAVPYVGPVALIKLLDYARESGLLDGGNVLVHGVEEGSPTALSILRLANTASFGQLDDEVGLDRRAATNILATRDEGAILSLAALDAVSWVGASAFERLSEYAHLTAGRLDPNDIDCGDRVHQGDVQITDIADAVPLIGITHITGDLTITGSERTDIRGLEDLICVSGSVLVQFNPGLESLSELGSLRLVRGDFTVDDSLAFEEMNIPLEYVGGGVSIRGNARAFDGLAQLAHVGGQVTFMDLGVPPTFDALSFVGGDFIISERTTHLPALPSLRSLPAGMTIEAAPNLNSTLAGFVALETVVGTVRIQDIRDITDLEGFSALRSAGAITLTHFQHLETISGFPALHTLSGGLTLQQNPELRHIVGFSDLTSVGSFTLVNPVDIRLSGLENLTVVTGDLTIRSGSVTAPLPAVQHVGGAVTLQGDFHTHPMPHLLTVGGAYSLHGNLNTAGPSPLISVGGSLVVATGNNPTFNWLSSVGRTLSVSGWAGYFPTLEHVGGYLNLVGDAAQSGAEPVFQSLLQVGSGLYIQTEFATLRGFGALTEVGELEISPVSTSTVSLQEIDGFDNLRIIHGPLYLEAHGITDLDSFSELTQLDGDLTIEAPAMSECVMWDFVETLTFDHGWRGTHDLRGLGC